MSIHDRIVAELKARKEAGEIRSVDLQRLLGIESSRAAEIFGGKRQLKTDEAFAVIHWLKMAPWYADLPDEGDAVTILEAVMEMLPPDFSPRERATAVWAGFLSGVRILNRNPELAGQSAAMKAVLRATGGSLQ